MKKNYSKDAKRVFEVLQKGGVAIVYMRNAYAIVSGTDQALKKVYLAKKRSLQRPSGIVAYEKTHEDLHILSKKRKRLSKHFLKNIIYPFQSLLLINKSIL